MPRSAALSRTTTETDIRIALELDGTGLCEVSHRRRLPGPHADGAGPALPVRPGGAGDRGPAHRRPPHGRGCGHRPGAGLRAGDRRQARHPPLRPGAGADGRGAGRGRDRHLRPAAAGLVRRRSTCPPSARWTPSCSRSSSAPSPTTRWSRCMFMPRPGATATISPRDASRRWPARCAWRRSRTRVPRACPVHQGGVVRTYTAHLRAGSRRCWCRRRSPGAPCSSARSGCCGMASGSRPSCAGRPLSWPACCRRRRCVRCGVRRPAAAGLLGHDLRRGHLRLRRFDLAHVVAGTEPDEALVRLLSHRAELGSWLV